MMHRQKTATFILLLILGINPILYGQGKTTSSDWFPLQIGNEWTYHRDKYFEEYSTFTEKIVDTTRIHGTLFYSKGYVGDSSPIFEWYRSSSESLFVARRSTIDTVETLLYNFNGEIGDSIPLSNIFSAIYGKYIKLVGKNDTVSTPTGVFTGCYHFKHYPSCCDGGYFDTWISKGVGRVKFIEDNYIGLITHNLISFKLTSVEQKYSDLFIPSNFFFNNYPNPFNPTTQFEYQIPENNFVTLKIFDVLGHEVATIVNEEKQEGKYTAAWNASQVSSGIYFATMTAGKFSSTKKLLLIK